jgi:4-amino-4-deoxy-L-arabinose transferase-like glycosyltransferase
VKRYAKILPIGLLLLAFALRLYRLDAQGLWWDEGISLHLATSSPADIVADRAANIHPPLYFFLLKGWVALVGSGAFGARFLSASASLVQVAVIYAVARRWLGRPTAWIAALFTAFSPLSVVYAQEIRVYALLPVVYLALLAVARELGQGQNKRRRYWLLLGLVEAVGLHLHYMVLFVVAYVGGWLLLIFVRARRWADLRRWVLTQFCVGLAGLPWLVAVLAHWPQVQGRIRLGRGLVEPVPMDYLLRQVWIFHLTGLTSAGGRYGLALFAGLTTLLLALAVLVRLVQTTSRRSTAWLAAHWLVPLGSALFVWNIRSFSHPRYVALYAIGLTLLVAYVLYPGRIKARPSNLALPSALAVSVLLTSALGLRAYFFDPALSKDDVRGVARYLETRAAPDDLILIPDGDWSLPFVYQGQTPIEMPQLADAEKLWADLKHWTTPRRRVFATGYPQGTRDQRGLMPFALEKAGSLVARQDFKGLFVYRYQLDHPVEPPALTPLTARFGPITLRGAWIERAAPANTALTLALRWRKEPSDAERYYLALDLLDEDGWSLAAADHLLLDERDRPTDHWSAAQEAVTYHVLPLPPGLPPLTYTLALGLYAQVEGLPRPLDLLDEQGAPQGQRLDLSAVRLMPSLDAVDNPYRITSGPPSLPQSFELVDGLQLLGATLDRATLMPGQALFVSLRWQAARAPLPDLRPRLALVQDGQELTASASAPALGRYPTNRWRREETVLDHRRLVAPPEASDGVAEVVLSLGQARLVLGTVEIAAGERLFSPPPMAYPLNVRFSEPAGAVARLIGYDLPARILNAGEPVNLTLYWQAGTTERDYVVFTHVLAADGHLIGQHDAPPANGRRPSGGWLDGEIIVDPHVMTFREPDYVGQARVEVGLYDPLTGERLVTDQGSDFFYLPLDLTIQQP